MKSLTISKNNLLNIVSFFMVFSSLYLFENKIVSMVGMICAICVLFLCALMLLINARAFSIDLTLGIFIFILVYLVAHVIFDGSFTALYFASQILGLLIVIIVLENAEISLNGIKKWKQYIRIIYYSIIIIYFTALLFNKVSTLNGIVSATILKVLFPLSWFAIKRGKKTTLLEIIIFVLFHFMLGERTAVLCMVVVLVFQFIIKRISNKASNILFWVVLTGAIAMPFVYVWLSEQPIGEMLNLYVYEHTGEYFFSGRNRIWKVIIDGMSGNWLLGLGFGNSLLADNGIIYSTHNLYMYLCLNGGIIMLILFSLFMYSIWRKIQHNASSDSSVIVGKAYILGLLVFLDMELFLLANNIVISLAWWITIAFIELVSKNRELNPNDAIKYQSEKCQ